MHERRYRLVRLASRGDTPTERLIDLSKDKDAAVRASVLYNPSPELPDGVVQGIAKRELEAKESSWVLRQAIAISTRVTADQHRAVAAAREWYVCIALANNPECPADLLKEFAKDPEPNQPDLLKEIRAIARQRLSKPSRS